VADNPTPIPPAEKPPEDDNSDLFPPQDEAPVQPQADATPEAKPAQTPPAKAADQPEPESKDRMAERLERLGGEPAPAISPEEFARLQQAGQIHIDSQGRVRTTRREQTVAGMILRKRRAWYGGSVEF